MNRSENVNELAAALAKAQGVMESAAKDTVNPFFKSHYADLAAVWAVARGPLSANGLSIQQHPGADGPVVSVETVLGHSSGQWVGSSLTMHAKDSSPQAIGSCITYARRYALASILGIASEEDDDGNAAQPPKGFTPSIAPPAKTKEVKPMTIATSVTRAAALDRLGCQVEGVAKNTLHSYLVALGWLEKEKSVEQWPIRFVPISADELEALKLGLTKFSQSGVASMPYAPHGPDPATLPYKFPSATTPTQAASDTDWVNFVMPFGTHKGKKLGTFTPEELRFYVKEFQPRTTVDVQQPDGSILTQPLPEESVVSQKALRAALDEAAAQLAKKG